MKTRINTFALLFVIGVCLIGACSDPADNSGEGTFYITLGTGDTSRAVWLNTTVQGTLTYNVTLTNASGGTQSQTDISAGTTISFTLAAGTWDIYVEAFVPAAAGTAAPQKKAEGSAQVTIVGGQSVTKTVNMDPYLPATGATDTDLQALINDAEDGATIRLPACTIAMNGTVNINKEITLTTRPGVNATLKRASSAPSNSSLINIVSGFGLTMEGSGSGKITLDGDNVSGAGYLVHLQSGSSLIMKNDNVILTKSTGGGVHVDTGHFTMVGGEISSNANGGVYVSNGGIFEMSGGKITLNTASDGGGVNIYGPSASTSFHMTGGTISHNTATDSGGGVNVYSRATFDMSGSAAITNNEATNYGGGVCIDAVTSGTYTTFTMTAGTISGNSVTDTTNGRGGGVFMSGLSGTNLTFTLQSTSLMSGNIAGLPQYGPQVFKTGTGTFTITDPGPYPPSNLGTPDEAYDW